MNTVNKARLLQNRRWRIRKKVTGTAARPRLAVRFTTKHVYAQAINDDAGHDKGDQTKDADAHDQDAFARLTDADLAATAEEQTQDSGAIRTRQGVESVAGGRSLPQQF